MPDWLVDETQELSSTQEVLEVRETADFEEESPVPLGVAIRDVTIHNTRKRFGSADVRLDAVFVSVPADPLASNLYAPITFRFSGIRDGERLPIDEKARGLLLYLGRPALFLDIAIAASRAEDDQPDLAELLANESDKIARTLRGVAQLAIGVPVVGGLTAAAAAAVSMSGLVLKLLVQATGRSIGLYRTTWFQYRDDFGLGFHPSDGDRFRRDDLEFCYEVFRDVPG
jgi:hypothetical protein